MAIKANLIIDQGVDYSTSVTLTNDDGDIINLSGYTAESQIRKTYTSLSAVDFNVSIAETQGVVSLALSANVSSNLVPGRYVYDVLLTNTQGIKSRIVEGIVTVTPRVTQ